MGLTLFVWGRLTVWPDGQIIRSLFGHFQKGKSRLKALSNTLSIIPLKLTKIIKILPRRVQNFAKSCRSVCLFAWVRWMSKIRQTTFVQDLSICGPFTRSMGPAIKSASNISAPFIGMFRQRWFCCDQQQMQCVVLSVYLKLDNFSYL